VSFYVSVLALVIWHANRIFSASSYIVISGLSGCRLRLKCDGTRAETIFRLSAKRTSPFKLTGASVQSTTGSRCVRIGVSNGGYTVFRGSVKSTSYPLHSPVSPSLSLEGSFFTVHDQFYHYICWNLQYCSAFGKSLCTYKRCWKF